MNPTRPFPPPPISQGRIDCEMEKRKTEHRKAMGCKPPLAPIDPPPPEPYGNIPGGDLMGTLGIPNDGSAMIESVEYEAGEQIDVSTWDNPGQFIRGAGAKARVTIRMSAMDARKAMEATGKVIGQRPAENPYREDSVDKLGRTRAQRESQRRRDRYWFAKIWRYLRWKVWNW